MGKTFSQRHLRLRTHKSSKKRSQAPRNLFQLTAENLLTRGKSCTFGVAGGPKLSGGGLFWLVPNPDLFMRRPPVLSPFWGSTGDHRPSKRFVLPGSGLISTSRPFIPYVFVISHPSLFLTFHIFTPLYFPPRRTASFLLFLSFSGLIRSHPVISSHRSHLSIYAYICHVLRSPLVPSFPSFSVCPCFSPRSSLHLIFFSFL